MAAVTTKLNIPLLEGQTHVAKGAINNALNAIENNALPNIHADSGVHWAKWVKEVEYKLKDVIRLDSMCSWGYLECTTAGKAGTTQPACPYGEDDTVPDGTVVWTLRRIGSVGNNDFCTKKQAIAYAIALG